MLIFSGTSDNEPSVALGVDQYLNFSGSLRCICHTLSLAVNDAIDSIPFLKASLKQINDISNFLSKHHDINENIVSEQCKTFTKDRIVTLKKECPTRWHSKLNVLEKYIFLKPILKKCLPSTAPSLLSRAKENAIAECIDVLREVRRTARALEVDRNISASRMPRLLYELDRTLKLYSASKDDREDTFKCCLLYTSDAADD